MDARAGRRLDADLRTLQRPGRPILGLLNLFSGGALSRFSLFALGIMPYVTASIILQLLTVVIPTLEQLQKEGESGYAKINQYTRYLTVALAGVQATGYTYLFKRQGALERERRPRSCSSSLTLTAGATLLMWMGEQITKRGIGNGISLLIFASILSALPTGISAWVNGGADGAALLPDHRARRRRRGRLRAGRPAADPDPVRQAAGGQPADHGRLDLHAAAREHGRRDPGHLRRGDHGVPADDRRSSSRRRRSFVNRTSRRRTCPTSCVEALLIIIFTYFYTAVQFNPVDQADNLRKYGGYIPGIRPGPPTAQYLDRVLTRLTLPGALYLASIASLPASSSCTAASPRRPPARSAAPRC